MSLQIMPLEDRIVFDAAVPNANPDDLSDDPLAQDANPDGSQTADGDNVDDGSLLVDQGGEWGGAAEAQAVRILVVSAAVDGAEILADATADGVEVVTYDPGAATLTELLAQIAAAVDGQEVASIGFAVHGGSRSSFTLVRNETVSLASLLEAESQQAFWGSISDLLMEDGRIDLLACNLTSTAAGRQLVEQLADLTGREVAASDDLTGNESAGGDWLLETGGIDLAATYFTAEGLEAYGETLVWVPPLIGNLNQDVANWTTGGGGLPVFLDVGSDAIVLDPDSTGYGGVNGRLEVRIDWGGGAPDQLDISLGGGYTWAGNTIMNGGNPIGTVVGRGTMNMTVDWTNFATDAHVRNIVRRIQFDRGLATLDTRGISVVLYDNENNMSWNQVNVNIDGPVVTTNNVAAITDGATVNLNPGAAELVTADPNAGGTVNIMYTIHEKTLNGNLWLDTSGGGTWMQLGQWDVFTQNDINKGYVEYRHKLGNPLFDSFNFRVSDDSVNPWQETAETRFRFDGAGDAKPMVDLDIWNAGNNTLSSLDPFMDTTNIWGTPAIYDDSAMVKTVTLTVTSRPDGGNEGLKMWQGSIARAAVEYGITITQSLGQIVLTSTSGAPIDVNNFNEVLWSVNYWHAFSTRTPGNRNIKVVANDGTGNISSAAFWTVNVEPDTGEPWVVNSWMEVTEGAARPIFQWMFMTADSDTSPANLVYTITRLPNFGWLRLNGNALGVGSQFTQQQINEGQLAYQHDGSPFAWDDFEFKVTDGTTTLNNMWFWINVLPEGVPLWDPGGDFGFGEEVFADDGFGDEGFGEEGFGEEGGEMGGEMAMFTDTDLSSGLGADEEGEDQEEGSQGQGADAEGDSSFGDVKEALDAAWAAYGADAEAAFLGGAITAIQEAEVSMLETDIVIERTLDIMSGLDSSIQELLQKLIDEISSPRGNIRSSTSDLKGLLTEATADKDRFDKAFGDAISASIVGLNQDNDRLTISYLMLDGLLDFLAKKHKDEEGRLDLQAVKEAARRAREAAEAKVATKRGQRDKAAKDVIEAAIKELFSREAKAGKPGKGTEGKTGGAKPQPEPEGGKKNAPDNESGDAGGSAEPGAGETQTETFAQASATLSAMSMLALAGTPVRTVAGQADSSQKSDNRKPESQAEGRPAKRIFGVRPGELDAVNALLRQTRCLDAQGMLAGLSRRGSVGAARNGKGRKAYDRALAVAGDLLAQS